MRVGLSPAVCPVSWSPNSLASWRYRGLSLFGTQLSEPRAIISRVVLTADDAQAAESRTTFCQTWIARHLDTAMQFPEGTNFHSTARRRQRTRHVSSTNETRSANGAGTSFLRETSEAKAVGYVVQQILRGRFMLRASLYR